jgi:tetratricopeptide (TPR) repeat protein
MPDNLDAYRWYLRAKYLLSRADASNAMLALEAADKAIELDPGYVPAYVLYAQANGHLVSWGVSAPEEKLLEIERTLDEARKLDPDYSDVYIGLALLRSYRNDWAGAEEAIQEAVELNPQSYTALGTWAYWLHSALGRSAEAAELMSSYLEGEPLDLGANSVYALSLAAIGQLDRAGEELERTMALDPNYSVSRYFAGNFYAYYLGEYAEALPWFNRAYELDPTNVQIAVDMVRLFLDFGDPLAAEHWLKVASDGPSESYFEDFAAHFLALYERDEALALSIARRLGVSIQRVGEGYHYIGDFAWLRSLHTADPGLASQVYARLYPELLASIPVVNPWNHAAAISLADFYLRSGDDERAEALLGQSIKIIDAATGRYFTPAYVAAYVLKGDVDGALQKLRASVDSGRRWEWWLLEREPIYAPLWDHPEFKLILNEIKLFMAEQLEQIRTMERSGEIKSVPELLAGQAAALQGLKRL